ncbi:TfpX/TfpZ family type IV pilin accessory protein [Lysobacter fragariae]
MSRWKASFIHLALSVLVISTIAAILVWRWYPPGLFHMAKADRLLIIMGSVDVVIGPLLTLIVFKQGKRHLKLDLALIAFVQVAALVYGLQTLWHSRPVYLVSMKNRFELIFANQIDPIDLRDAAPEYRRLPWLTVKTVAAMPPANAKERAHMLFSALAGKDIDVMPKYYAPYANVAPDLLRNSLAVTDLLQSLPKESARGVTRAVAATGQPAGRIRAVPIISSRGFATMLVDARDGGVIRPVAADPTDALERRAQTQSKPLSEGQAPKK